MTPNPIARVLSTLSTSGVQYLLMGGQACVLYGAAEFSRDCDVALLASPENLDRLRTAVDQLQAERIAVPPFEAEYLERGHAVHFRCRRPDVDRMRLDVMTTMRGVAPFDELWARRTTVETPEGDSLEVMGLPDLVQAKKTQRDKDWPMIRRLVEAHYASHQNEATPERIRFWLAESRTPSMLIALACEHMDEAMRAASERPLVAEALHASQSRLRQALSQEEADEREADRQYWAPLKRELEQLRRKRGG